MYVIIETEPSANRQKRGKSNDLDNDCPMEASTKKKLKPNFPSDDIRFDNFNHFGYHDTKPNASRCKNPGCTYKTHLYCTKCQVHLCLISSRNCFWDFHKSKVTCFSEPCGASSDDNTK